MWRIHRNISLMARTDDANLLSNLVTDAINSIRKKHHKRPDKDEISKFMHKKHDIAPEYTVNLIENMEERGIIYAVVKGNKHSYFCTDSQFEDQHETDENFSDQEEASHVNARKTLDFLPLSNSENQDINFTRWLMDLVNSQRGAF